MSRFAAPIAEQIWDMKYRFKQADGTAIDHSVEDSWRRIARATAAAELAGGRNVAVVFNGATLPDRCMGAPVIDGDASDLRYLDPSPAVVGLRAKGRAIGDTSGFAVAS